MANAGDLSATMMGSLVGQPTMTIGNPINEGAITDPLSSIAFSRSDHISHSSDKILPIETESLVKILDRKHELYASFGMASSFDHFLKLLKKLLDSISSQSVAKR